MNSAPSCPHCGLPTPENGIASLTRELDASQRTARERTDLEKLAGEQQIAELTREVRILRETVARLRSISQRASVTSGR